MQVKAYKHNDNENLIPPIGSCGAFRFSFSKVFGRITGFVPILLIDFHRCESKNKMKVFDRKFTVIDDKFDTKGNFKYILDGLKYKSLSKIF